MHAFNQAIQIENPTGLWLIYGEEPLVASWIMDYWRVYWNEKAVNRKVIETKSAKTWLESLSEFNAMSLFSEQTVVELQATHKPDKKGIEQLKSFCEKPEDNCLIVLMPKIDWKAKTSAFYKTCEKYGNVLDTSIKNNSDKRQLLEIKATKFGLSLQADAWQLLFDQTQNNLLSAYQALWRMSDLASINYYENMSDTLGKTSVNAEMLLPALVSQSRFSQYDLIDSILNGNIASIIEIINYLRESKEAPSLILWNLAKEARIIIQLLSGASVNLTHWQLKKYQKTTALLKRDSVKQWTHLLLEIDKSVKGLSVVPEWELITQLSLSMAGKPIFVN